VHTGLQLVLAVTLGLASELNESILKMMREERQVGISDAGRGTMFDVLENVLFLFIIKTKLLFYKQIKSN